MTEHALRWVFVGQGHLSAAALDRASAFLPPALVVTGMPRSPDSPVIDVAATHGAELRQVSTVSDDPVVLEAARGADIAVCCGWSERLAGGLLAAPREGWLNLHPSLLPQWRGADPIAWQLLTGARELGATAHRMTPRFDDGPIVAATTIPARDDDKRTAAVRVGAALGGLAREALETISRGEHLPEREQDPSRITWCPPLGVAPLVDPARLRAAQAIRVLRACSPRPGAAVEGVSGGRRAVSPRPGNELAADDRPGMIREPAPGHLAIACVDRWIAAEVLPRP